MALENDYEIESRLGEGAFGKVYKAKHKSSGDLVAVKQIKLGSKSWDEALKSTELAALRALRHPFIVRLRELIRSPLDGSLYYVFEFIGSDLCRLIRHHPQGMEEGHATELQRQIFAGLAHIHQHNFFHRDVKPENILYNDEQDTVRIADFGEARSLRARPPFTDYVGTRWYRSPECLLRDRNYSSPVDIWAAGLVFAELLRGSPVFSGSSSIDQLYKIFQVLGQPPLSDWPEFTRLADACRFRVPDGAGCGLHRVLPRSTPQAQALLSEILRLNPRRRPLARKCLEHALFARCPPLELDKAEVWRSGRGSLMSAASVGSGGLEERSDTCRSPASVVATPLTASTARGVPDEAEPPLNAFFTMEPLPARTPLTAEPASVAPTAADDSDLDLDAELDKILSVGTPRRPSRGPTGAQAHTGPPAAATHFAACRPELVKYPAAGGGAYMGAAPSSPRSRGDDLRGQRGSIRARSPMEPMSPGHASVDALLHSLCEDLGVAPGSEATTQASAFRATASSSPSATPPSASPLLGWSNPRRQLGTDSSGEDAEAEVILPQRKLAGSPTLLRDGSGAQLLAERGAAPGAGAWSAAQADLERERYESLMQPEGAGRGPLHPAHSGSNSPQGSPASRHAALATVAAPRRPSSAAACRGGGRLACGGLPEAPLTATPVRSRAGTGKSLAGATLTSSSSALFDMRGAGLSAGEEAGGDRLGAALGRREAPWSAEESAELRRAVKRVVRRGPCEKDALWAEVSRELGGFRGPRECKQQYARDYRAHKAAGGARAEGDAAFGQEGLGRRPSVDRLAAAAAVR